MGDVALEGGFYKAKSLIAGAQACTNLYPEKNQKGAPFPWTYYQRPGNELALTGPGAAARCQYRATNGQMFEVLGTAVYYTDSTPARHLLGTIAAGSTQCSMADNGTVQRYWDAQIGTPDRRDVPQLTERTVMRVVQRDQSVVGC